MIVIVALTSGITAYVFLVPVPAQLDNLTITYYIHPVQIVKNDQYTMYQNSNYTIDLRIETNSPSPVQWSLQGDGYRHLALEVNYKGGVYQRAQLDLDEDNSIECTVKQGEPKYYTISAGVDAAYEWRNSDGSVFTGVGDVPSGYDLLPQQPQSTSLLYMNDNRNNVETYEGLPMLTRSETPISP